MATAACNLPFAPRTAHRALYRLCRHWESYAKAEIRQLRKQLEAQQAQQAAEQQQQGGGGGASGS